MKIKLEKFTPRGIVDAIPSKSYAHRILICNYLASGKIDEDNLINSKDILATKRCLKALMADEVLDAGESGSTLRFFIPIVSALGGEYTFIGQGKLMSRPNDELFNCLNEHGVTAKKLGDKITVNGKLTSGEYKLRGDISSQYFTGLMMTLPLLEGDSVIVPTTPLVSLPYIFITLEVLKNHGIDIKFDGKTFFIKGGQKYKTSALKVEGDWSNSAFFLVAGAIAGDITVKGLNFNSAQGDKKIVEILSSAGATLKIDGDKITVKKSVIKPFAFDAEDCPDLVPICSILAGVAKGESVIKNVSRLKIKESDRILSTVEMLKKFGVTAKENSGDLIINGNGGAFTGDNVCAYNDHRIVMSAGVASLIADSETVIDGYEAVDKSYPSFFDDLYSLRSN